MTTAMKSATKRKIVNVEIQGRTALLMHKFAVDNEVEKSTRKVERQAEDPRDVAEKAAYRMHDGRLYLPGACFIGMLREAGAGHKSRNSRRSIKYMVANAVRMPEEVVPLVDGDGKPAKKFEVDSRPVVIRATKGRIMRHRPKLNEWGAKLSLQVDESLLSTDLVNTLMVEGGEQVGVGDYRPDKGGPFGTFTVTKWEVVEK